MKGRSASKIKLTSYDELLGGGEETNDIQQVSLEHLHSFENHPFQVNDDEAMAELVESVKEEGILTALLVRPLGDGEYEIIAGHRRRHAAQLAGLKEVPVIIRNMDQDTAVRAMVDSNLQRPNILPSEKAFAYRMKMEAMNHQGTSGGISAKDIGKNANDSARQVYRYIRLAMQQTDQTKKQQKRIPQITTRLEQIDKVLNKLYEDNALGTIPQDRYEQMSQKYSEEYYTLKTELAGLQEQLSAYENAGGRAQKFLKLTERHAAFTDLTPAILNEFISRIEVHERDQKRARYAIQHISIYFNYIGRFENEVTQLAEPTEQEIRQMREEIEEAKKKKSRAYHRQYSREYRARNLEKQREYDRIKAREYRARRKAQTAAAQPAQ